MPAVSVGQLLDLLREGNLLTAEQWTDLRRLVLSPAVSRRFARPDTSKPPGESAGSALSADDVVHWLVDRGWVTRWQGDMLLAGRAPVLGRYRLLDCIGSGGMGAVFKAWHGGTGRVVALKVMADAIVQNAKAVARFHKEIQAVASLNHPNIVSAYDADCVRRMHFLVMEYVDGHDLGWYLANTRSLPAGWVCEVIRQAALGLHHAHERGMIHRDVKPTNLLVARDPETGGPLVKVLDLGLARFATEPEEEGGEAIPSRAGEAGLTQAGQVLGTPDYMSPEQANDTRRADVRSDIFSLGCTLFRLLTHEYPFPGDSVVEKIAARQVKPARRLRELRGDFPRELEAVVAKMLAPDPRQRYQSALEVAFALAPFSHPDGPAPSVSGSKTPAREKSSSGRLSIGDDPRLKEFLANMATRGDGDAPTRVGYRVPIPGWSRKTWITISGTAVGILVLALVWRWVGQVTLAVDWPGADRKDATLIVNGRSVDLSGTGTISVTGRSGKWELQLTRTGYEPIRETLSMTFGEHRPWSPQWRPTPKTSRLNELAEFRKRADSFKSTSPSDKSLLEFRRQLLQFRCRNAANDESAAAARMLASLPSPLDGLKRSDISEDDLRLAGVGDPRYAPDQLVGMLGEGRLRFWNRVLSLSVSHDGNWVAAASLDGTVKIYDRRNSRDVQILRLSNEPTEVLFNPAESILAVSGGRREITLWRFSEGMWSLQNTLRGLEAPVAFSGNGTLVAAHGRRNEIVICNTSDGKPRKTVHSAPRAIASRLVLNGDGTLLAAECRDDSVFLWNLSGEEAPVRFPRTRGPTFDPKGRRVAAGGLDGDLRIWNAASGALEQTMELGGMPIGFSADGETLVSYRNGRVVVWDIQNGAARRTLVDVPPLARLSPSGDGLFAASDSVSDFRVWNLKNGASPILAEVNVPVSIAAWVPDESRILTANADFGLREWDATTGREVAGPTSAWGPVAVHPEGTPIAIPSNGKILLHALEDEAGTIPTLEHAPAEVTLLNWSPDGRWIAGASGGGLFGSSLRMWDALRGKEVPIKTDQPGPVRAMAFSVSGQRFATSGEARVVSLWDVSRRAVQETFDQFPDRVHSLAFERSRRWLAGAGRDGKLFAWDMNAHSGLSLENPTRSKVHQLGFSPNGKRLAAATDAGLMLWDIDTGRHLRTLVCRPNSPLCLSFSPTGDRLAAAGSSGTVWLWDWSAGALPGEEPDETLAIGPSGGLIRQIFWSSDNRHLLSVNANATIYVLRIPPANR